MNEATDGSTRGQGNSAGRGLLRELRGIRLALETLAAQKTEGRRTKSETEVITWLIEFMQSADSLPSLSEISRMTGVPRRQFVEDRWPKFRKTFEQLKGLERGIGKSRMAVAYDDE